MCLKVPVELDGRKLPPVGEDKGPENNNEPDN
jgi:hypothetical protein